MDTVYWTMKDGRQINIDDMSEEHVRNTLKMIVRNSQRKTLKPIGNIEYNFMEDQIKDWEDDEFYEN